MNVQQNPYSAPQARVADVSTPDMAELPSRWLRLGGVIIDAIAVSVITIPTLYFTGYFAHVMERAVAQQDPDIATQLYGAAFGFGVFLAVHGWLLWSNGQTLGKRLLGMKIVDMRSRAKPGFGRLLGLRYLVPQLIYMVPIAGSIVALIGILLVFRADRRPLHDHTARTQVVVVR